MRAGRTAIIDEEGVNRILQKIQRSNIIDNSITYTEKDGIFYPDVVLPKQPQVALGKNETETQSRNAVEQIVASMAKSDATEKTLKAENSKRRDVGMKLTPRLFSVFYGFFIC